MKFAASISDEYFTNPDAFLSRCFFLFFPLVEYVIVPWRVALNLFRQHQMVVSKIFLFSPLTWGRRPIWRAYFSKRLVEIHQSDYRIYLVIQSDLFVMVKWPFQGVKWPPTRDEKGTLNHLVMIFSDIFLTPEDCPTLQVGKFVHLAQYSNIFQMGWKWGFPKFGVPQNGWFIMESPIKMDYLGVPLFSETSKCWNHQPFEQCLMETISFYFKGWKLGEWRIACVYLWEDKD